MRLRLFLLHARLFCKLLSSFLVPPSLTITKRGRKGQWRRHGHRMIEGRPLPFGVAAMLAAGDEADYATHSPRLPAARSLVDGREGGMQGVKKEGRAAVAGGEGALEEGNRRCAVAGRGGGGSCWQMRVRREGRKRAVKEGLATDADSGMTFKWEERKKGGKGRGTRNATAQKKNRGGI